MVNEDGREIRLFTYDAYLAHSTKDLDWIMTELLDFLEKERGLKVFLEERDSQAGAVIMDNINKCVHHFSYTQPQVTGIQLHRIIFGIHTATSH